MKNKKSSWIVTAVCEVKKEIVCSNCTEEEAKEYPFQFAESERDLDVTNWDVSKVEENL